MPPLNHRTEPYAQGFYKPEGRLSGMKMKWVLCRVYKFNPLFSKIRKTIHAPLQHDFRVKTLHHQEEGKNTGESNSNGSI